MEELLQKNFYFFLSAMEVKIASCGVLELWQGLSCENSQHSGLQQSGNNAVLGLPLLTEKLNLAGRKS